MGTDLLNLSVSGLRANQTALSTTGHNISNAATEGYSRQRITSVATAANATGAGFIGSGVQVTDISRLANDFINTQLRTDSTLSKEINLFYNKVGDLNNLLSNQASGLSASLETFFSAMQNGSTDPTSIPARQLIISEAQNTADRFNTLFSRMDAVRQEVNSAMQVDVSQINALTGNIAQLNLKITDAQAFSTNGQPNDLLDQRDEALRKLSELVAIQSFDQGNGQINVLVGSGQSLVVGGQAQALALEPNPNDMTQLSLAIQRTDGKNIPVTLTGGDLGGLFRFRDESLNPAFNQLGRVAVVMAETFNTQHQQGITLKNQFGKPFFNDINAPSTAQQRVIPSAQNPPPNSHQMAVYLRNTTEITPHDYEVSIEGNGLFRVKRLSDQAEIATGLLPGTFPFSTTFDGIELRFEGGIYLSGDRFTLQPVHNGARDFSRIIANPEDIAFASPLQTQSDLGNLGNGKISQGEVLSLVDANNTPLPLFQIPGQMTPPLVVKFTSSTTYDILDNTSPSQPKQLNPPLRNLNYVPGANNTLFPANPNATQITTQGDLIGLPEGRRPIQQGAVIPAGVAPSFAVQDFSSGNNQFSFDLTISNTLGGLQDGIFTLNITNPAISDNTTLLQTINAQLGTSAARAYIDDNGALAFQLTTPGYGNITLNNYNPDPDTNGLNAPAGQANALLGFAIETNSYTSTGGLNGIEGFGQLSNGYPSEVITLTRQSTNGGAPEVISLATRLNASAKELAASLNNISGVSANAFTYAEITSPQITKTEPLQISLNGINLLNYSYDSLSASYRLDNSVPDPNTYPNEFNDYLAEQINSNATLKEQGITALAASDSITGTPELRLYAHQGDDINIQLIAKAGDTLNINDGKNPNLTLTGQGGSIASAIAVGGSLDVSMDKGLSLATFPDNSLLFGDLRTRTPLNTYLGIQAILTGTPTAGDTFSLKFNQNAASDNRNALSLINLQTKKTMEGGIASYSDSYGTLVEVVGIQTNSAKINSEAAKQVLNQTTQLRDSVSGVNMDEEAANLVKYQQFYSANARVIQVARDLFDTLLKSFG